MLKELAARFGIETSLITKMLRMMGIHRKKTLRYAQTFNHHKILKRRRFLKHEFRAKQHLCPVVYIDETGFATAPVATTVGQKVDTSAWVTTSQSATT